MLSGIWTSEVERYGVAKILGNTSDIRQKPRNPMWMVGKTCFTLKIGIVYGIRSRLHFYGSLIRMK